jgi:nitroreductase
MYAGNPMHQRDEAICSGAMAAMMLMLAAESVGLVSGAMIGFNPPGVGREFQLTSIEVPVMLLAVGHSAANNWQQKPRRAVAEALAFA